jgi:hypothetical protein
LGARFGCHSGGNVRTMATLSFAPGAPPASELRVNLGQRNQLLRAIEAPAVVRRALIEGEPDWWRMVGRKFVMNDSIEAPFRPWRESFKSFVPRHAITNSTKASQC